MRVMLLVLLFSLPSAVRAQERNFVGGFIGVSTLSADGAFSIEGSASAQSQYKPENGPTVMVFAGRHLHDHFSVQMSYGWNRNSTLLTASEFDGVTAGAYEQDRRNSQHTVIGEGLVYFRDLESRVRPYLSGGVGFHHFSSTRTGTETVIGAPVLPPPRFTKTGAAFRVAVGIDVLVRRNLSFRYSFSETIQANPLSKQLRPQGERNLANFQNLFGFTWRF